MANRSGSNCGWLGWGCGYGDTDFFGAAVGDDGDRGGAGFGASKVRGVEGAQHKDCEPQGCQPAENDERTIPITDQPSVRPRNQFGCRGCHPCCPLGRPEPEPAGVFRLSDLVVDFCNFLPRLPQIPSPLGRGRWDGVKPGSGTPAVGAQEAMDRAQRPALSARQGGQPLWWPCRPYRENADGYEGKFRARAVGPSDTLPATESTGGPSCSDASSFFALVLPQAPTGRFERAIRPQPSKLK
jgi:hypothetical protein